MARRRRETRIGPNGMICAAGTELISGSGSWAVTADGSTTGAVRRLVARSALAAARTDSRSQAGGPIGSRDSAMYGSTPPRSLISGCGCEQVSRCRATSIISPVSSAPRTKPEASSRMRSQVIAISSQTLLATRRWHGLDDLLAQCAQSQPHAAFHRAERGVGLVGDLALGQTVEVGQLDDLALGRRQNGECAPYLLGVPMAGNLGPDVGQGERSGKKFAVRLVAERNAFALPAHGIDGAVADDREQPAPDAALGLGVAGGIAPQAQERVLNHVFRQPGLGGDTQGKRIRHRVITVV